MSVGENAVSDSALRALVAGAALVVIVSGLRAGATLLVPLAVAGMLAVTTHPLVAWLERRGLPTWTAVLVTLLLLVTMLLGPGLVILNAATSFVSVAPRYAARLSTMSEGVFEWLQARGLQTSPLSDLLNWTRVVNLARGVVTNAAFLVSNGLLVLFVVAFVLMESAGLPALFARALLVDQAATDRFHQVTLEVQRYLRVKTGVSLATGLLLGLWTALLGVDFAVLWGLLAFLLNYIPNFGSIVAAVPAVLLSLVQAGPGRALAVLAGFVAVNVVLGSIVEPLVMGRRLRLSPLVVVLSLIFWGWVWGAVGMVLAVPITMIARILLEQSPEWRWVAVLIAGGRLSNGPRAPGR